MGIEDWALKESLEGLLRLIQNIGLSLFMKMHI